MNVRVHFLGILAQYFPASSVPLELPGTPTVSDLCAEIGRRFGEKLPANLWDSEKEVFTSPVFIRGKGRDLSTPTEVLLEGEEIYFLIPQAGG